MTHTTKCTITVTDLNQSHTFDLNSEGECYCVCQLEATQIISSDYFTSSEEAYDYISANDFEVEYESSYDDLSRDKNGDVVYYTCNAIFVS